MLGPSIESATRIVNVAPTPTFFSQPLGCRPESRRALDVNPHAKGFEKRN